MFLPVFPENNSFYLASKTNESSLPIKNCFFHLDQLRLEMVCKRVADVLPRKLIPADRHFGVMNWMIIVWQVPLEKQLLIFIGDSQREKLLRKMIPGEL